MKNYYFLPAKRNLIFNVIFIAASMLLLLPAQFLFAQQKVGDNLGNHVAEKDLEMKSFQVLNTSGIAIGTATITGGNSIGLQLAGGKAIQVTNVSALSDIATPVTGMVVYLTSNHTLYVYQTNDWNAISLPKLSPGQVVVGNNASIALARTLSGDITLNSLGQTLIQNNAVNSDKIAANAIVTTKIADGSVTASKLANSGDYNDKVLTTNSLGVNFWAERSAFASSDLNDGQIRIGNSSNVATAVTPTGDVTINNAGVTAIGTGKVVTTNIADGNVTDAKLASSTTSDLNRAVGTDHIKNSNITTVKIADANITEVKLATDAVTTVKIKDANVTAAKLSSSTTTDADRAVGTDHIKNSNITTAKIADANITEVKLATDAVTTTKIKDGNVTAAKLATVGNSKILVTTITGTNQWASLVNKISLSANTTLTAAQLTPGRLVMLQNSNANGGNAITITIPSNYKFTNTLNGNTVSTVTIAGNGNTLIFVGENFDAGQSAFLLDIVGDNASASGGGSSSSGIPDYAYAELPKPTYSATMNQSMIFNLTTNTKGITTNFVAAPASTQFFLKYGKTYLLEAYISGSGGFGYSYQWYRSPDGDALNVNTTTAIGVIGNALSSSGGAVIPASAIYTVTATTGTWVALRTTNSNFTTNPDKSYVKILELR